MMLGQEPKSPPTEGHFFTLTNIKVGTHVRVFLPDPKEGWYFGTISKVKKDGSFVVAFEQDHTHVIIRQTQQGSFLGDNEELMRIQEFDEDDVSFVTLREGFKFESVENVKSPDQ